MDFGTGGHKEWGRKIRKRTTHAFSSLFARSNTRRTITTVVVASWFFFLGEGRVVWVGCLYMLISATSSSIRSPKTLTEKSQSASSNTELDWAQYYMHTHKQNPSLVCSKKNTSHLLCGQCSCPKDIPFCISTEAFNKNTSKYFSKNKIKLCVTKPFLRETEAREPSHSFSVFILSFHVREIEFIHFTARLFCYLFSVIFFSWSPVGFRPQILPVLPTSYICTEEAPLAILVSRIFSLAYVRSGELIRIYEVFLLLYLSMYTTQKFK